MMFIAAFGEKIKSFYARWAAYIDAAARLLLAGAFFFRIQALTGAGGKIPVPVLLAVVLLSALMGSATTALTGSVLIILNAFFTAPAAGAYAACVLVLLYLLFLRLVPEDLPAFLLMPMSFFVGVPAVVPIVCGLRRKPSSVFAVISGTVACFLGNAIAEAGEQLSNLESSDYIGGIRAVSERLLTMETAVTVLAAAAVLLTVYAVRRAAFRFSFETAIILGGAVWVLVMLLGNRFAGTGFNPVKEGVGAAASSVAALLLNMLFLQLEYRKARSLRFEDDSYYYYVRAVPKVTGKGGNLPEADLPVFDEINEIVDHTELEKRLEDSLKNL